MIGKLIAYIVRSVVTKLLVIGVVLAVLRFGPWGSLFQFAGVFPGDSRQTGSHEFAQVVEDLRSGADPAQGYDPVHGFTDVNPTVNRNRPRGPGSGGSSEGAFAGLMRKLGFRGRPVSAPEWVPVFPGSIDEGTIRQSMGEGEKTIIRAAVPATGSSVATFYERAFTRMGYTFTSEESGSETNFAAESPDGARTVTVAISARGARSTLAIAHLERANLASNPESAMPRNTQ